MTHDNEPVPSEVWTAVPGVVLTKLHPPRSQATTVERERLTRLLQDAESPRLVLVAAPAGHGKSTLMGAWAQERRLGGPVAWVTADEADNDVIVLWSHILTSLAQACPDLRTSGLPTASGLNGLVDLVLPVIINQLTELPPVTLFIDDFHTLTSRDSRESITWFLEHAPDTLTLVVGTRMDPHLPVAALRARGRLVEVRSADLRFTTDEASTFLNDRLGLELDGVDIKSLTERTEGWPAGLYLAALSLRNSDNRHELVTRFGASNTHVLDFLVDEVFDRFTPSTQQFMMQISVLERFNAELCEAVTHNDQAAFELAELSRTNLFLIALDDEGKWFRFHHLFGQLLHADLKRRSPDLIPTLHQRAATWHLTNGTVDEAVHHALACANYDQVCSIIRQAWIDFTNACRYETVLAWFGQLPAEVLNADPRLLAIHAWVLSLCGRRQEAGSVLALLDGRQDLAAGPLDDGFASVESSVTMVRAIFPWGDVGAQIEYGERALVLEPTSSPWYPVGVYAVGLGSYFAGNMGKARSNLARANELALPAQQWLVAGSSLAYGSIAASEASDWQAQHQLAELAAAFAAEFQIEDVAGEVHVALGLSYAVQGDIQAARSLLERGVLVLRAWAQPTELAEALLRLGTVCRAQGDIGRMRSAFDEARAVVESCVDPGKLPQRLTVLDPAETSGPQDRAALTDREIVILRHLASDQSERQIAATLYVSPNTVHTQVRSVYNKLGVTSRSDAVSRARALGLL